MTKSGWLLYNNIVFRSYTIYMDIPRFGTFMHEWTIPQLDKVLNSKTVLTQLERAS